MNSIDNSSSIGTIGSIKAPNFAAWLKAQSECVENIDNAIANGTREMLVHAAPGFGKTTIYKRIIKSSKGPCWINLPTAGSKEILAKDLDLQSPKYTIDLNSMSKKFLDDVINKINKDSVILCTYPLLNMIHKNHPELFDKLMAKLGSFEYPAQIHSDEAHRGIGKQTITALKQMTKEEELGEDFFDDSDEIEKVAQEFEEDEREYDDTITNIMTKNKNIYNICRTATPTYSHKSIKSHFPTVFTFTKQQALEIGVSVPVRNISLGEGIQYVSKENYTEKDLMNGVDRYFIYKTVKNEIGEDEDKLFRADELITQTVADLHRESPVKAMGVGANIKQLYDLEKIYESQGIRTYIIHSGNKKYKASGNLVEAKNLIESGQIDMILVCNTGVELLDIPTLNLGVMHYSPYSPVKINQFIGRIDRTNESKEFTRFICPPTKIIYEHKEDSGNRKTPNTKSISTSPTVGKLRREDAYYTLGDFTIEYLKANGLTYLQIYEDYLNLQKSKRELLESTKGMIRKSFQSGDIVRKIQATKDIYEMLDLGDSYDIHEWLNNCKNLIAMDKIWMYNDKTIEVRLGGKAVYLAQGSKFDEKDIIKEMKTHIGDHPLMDKYQWKNLNKANISEHITNLENLRNKYEEDNGIATTRPTGGVNGGIGATNRNIKNRDKYVDLLKDPKVIQHSNKLIELILPYIVYVVNFFEKDVMDNGKSLLLNSDDYISICSNFFSQNIALYQNVSHTRITQRVSSMTIDILLKLAIKYDRYGIETDNFIKDMNYVENKEKEATKNQNRNRILDLESNRSYQDKKAHIVEYVSWGKGDQNDKAEYPLDFGYLHNEDLKIEINRVVKTLTQREGEVLEIYFGLNDYRTGDKASIYQDMIKRSRSINTGEVSDHILSNFLFEYIGTIFSLTRERVRQIKEKAISRMTKRGKSKPLKRYIGGDEERDYIEQSSIPNTLDNEQHPVLEGSVYENIYIPGESFDVSEGFDTTGISTRELLLKTIKSNFVTKNIESTGDNYAFLKLYDYMIGCDSCIPDDMIKAILHQSETEGFRQIITYANKVRNKKGLKLFDMYSLFDSAYGWFQLLEHQRLVELSYSEYEEIKKYIYCTDYPQNEDLNEETNGKLQKLQKLKVIGPKLIEAREINLAKTEQNSK